MKKYMLDTNIVAYLLKQNPKVVNMVTSVPMASLCISSITEGEILFGLAKKPEAKKLHSAVNEFFKRVDTLSWNSDVAKVYGTLRADMEKSGKVVASLDLLIAAHALAEGVILVTNDHVFRSIPGLSIEDWSF